MKVARIGSQTVLTSIAPVPGAPGDVWVVGLYQDAFGAKHNLAERWTCT
jgi:hypothetical protein